MRLGLIPYPKDEGPLTGEDTPGRVDAEQALDQMTLQAERQKFTTHALPGDPASAILQVAHEVGADLIVVGNKRMQGPGRFPYFGG